MGKIVHKVIAKAARAMCAEWYETAAHENGFYKLHPSAKAYVNQKWRYFIGYARQCLATALQSPALSDEQKAEIYEALVIDGSYKASPIIKPSIH